MRQLDLKRLNNRIRETRNMTERLATDGRDAMTEIRREMDRLSVISWAAVMIAFGAVVASVVGIMIML